MSLQGIIEGHIAKMAQIEQDGAEFSRRVAEQHVKVIERDIDPKLQLVEKLFAKQAVEPEGVS